MALADELKAPFASLDAVPAAPVLPESLPMKFVSEASALPLADDGEILRLALSDPLDDFTLRAVAMKTRRRLEVFVASADAIREAIAQIYRSGAAAASASDARAPAQRHIFDDALSPAPARPERAERSVRRPLREAADDLRAARGAADHAHFDDVSPEDPHFDDVHDDYADDFDGRAAAHAPLRRDDEARAPIPSARFASQARAEPALSPSERARPRKFAVSSGAITRDAMKEQPPRRAPFLPPRRPDAAPTFSRFASDAAAPQAEVGRIEPASTPRFTPPKPAPSRPIAPTPSVSAAAQVSPRGGASQATPSFVRSDERKDALAASRAAAQRFSRARRALGDGERDAEGAQLSSEPFESSPLMAPKPPIVLCVSDRPEEKRRQPPAENARQIDPGDKFAMLRSAPSPRRRGVVAPSRKADRREASDYEAKPDAINLAPQNRTEAAKAEPLDQANAAAGGAGVRPKFVRPKRVTLKDRTDETRISRMSREDSEMEFDPLAIPPMEDETGSPSFDDPIGEAPPARRRFVRGFVGGFMGGDQKRDSTEGANAVLGSDRIERDSAARRRVASDVRAALRGEAPRPVVDEPLADAVETPGAFAPQAETFKTPAPKPHATAVDALGAAASEDEPARAPAVLPPPKLSTMLKDDGASNGSETSFSALSLLDTGESAQFNAAAYQAASALAQRKRRREAAKQSAAQRLRQGAAVQHQITTKKVETPVVVGPKSASVVADLEALGYREGARDALETAVRSGEGLILICGPSGAGKTSTSTALAKRCAGAERAIERFDRPVEQRESDAPDSDLVLMGVINDAESADIAVRAAMRGALVIATLDVESVAGAAPRLVSMGLPPFALASCLRAVAAQHQAPRVCARCAGSGRAVEGGECVQCCGTGVDGEVNIVEVMAMDDAMRALILAQAPEEAFRHAMTAAGTPTLADDAEAKIAAGLTSADGAAAAAAAARA